MAQMNQIIPSTGRLVGNGFSQSRHVSQSTMVVGFNGPSGGKQSIMVEFGIQEGLFPHSYWLVTTWALGAALIAIFTLPLLETFGVKYGFLASYALFIIFIIPQALAKNFSTLIITRFITGGCAGIIANSSGCIICDVWQDCRKRGFPLAVYIWGYCTGLTIAPLIGAAIDRHLSWRWIFYIQVILYGACFPFFVVIIPEVRREVILKRRAKKIRQTTGKQIYAPGELEAFSVLQMLQNAVLRPLKMLFTEPVVFCFALWSSFSLGTVFVSTQSISQVYETNYGWDAFQTGAVQCAMAIGEFLGLLASLLQNKLYQRSAARNKTLPGKPIPEARLYLSIVGSFLGLTVGFFWFGWTSYPRLHWILPTIGLTLVGFGVFTVSSAVTNYVTDSYANYAASALGAIAFGQYLTSGFLPLAAKTIYTRLGFQWASSMLGFMALGLSFVPVVLLWKGEAIRKRSPFISRASRD